MSSNAYSTQVGVDNWQATITTVPGVPALKAPGMALLALLLSATAAVLVRAQVPRNSLA